MSNIIKFEDQKRDLDHLKSLARIASESKQYASLTEVQLLNLMLTAKDMGISPMKSINGGFYIVQGKVCMSTSLMADRIRKDGHSIKITEMSKDKCIIIAVRKDNGDSLKFEYTWEDATLAGLTGSPTWKKFPKIMLYNRCMSAVARILFSDVIGNCYSEEERFDIQNVPPSERPLEPQDGEIVIQGSVSVSDSDDASFDRISNALSDGQRDELEELVLDKSPEVQAVIERVCKHYEIDALEKIPAKDFERVTSAIRKKQVKKEESNEQTRVA